MSDANTLLRRPPDAEDPYRARYEAIECTFLEALGIIADLNAANHALTVRLAEKEETIAALNVLAAKLEAVIAALGGGKPELRVVREEDLPSWMEHAK